MLFNSFDFLVGFLPVVVGAFYLLARRRALALAWLGGASLAFYAWWDVRYLWLLITSIVANFLAGRALSRRPRPSRALLATAIGGNLVLLAVYKYADFVLRTVNETLGTALPVLDLALPLGISFFTFTQIAFLVDSWRGEAREYRFVNYLLFVTWFPHLIAGPILHHKALMPQFERASTFRAEAHRFQRGAAFFTIGLAKKVLLADGLAGAVGQGFDRTMAGLAVDAWHAWSAVLAYTFQLYFDFSGYCDMALGVSLLFGVTLPLNFDRPYRATNIADFWRRWHMTLSGFLRDYLYFPLGGNRRGPHRRYANLLATMVLGGLWHGANWTFLVWGAWHGAWLAAYHAWRGGRPEPLRRAPWWSAASVAATFGVVVVGWVFFRAASLDAAVAMFSAMGGSHGLGTPPDPSVLWLLLASAVGAFVLPDVVAIVDRTTADVNVTATSQHRARSWAVGVGYGLLLTFCLTQLSQVSAEFLYYQF